jgi:hypothetical protein
VTAVSAARSGTARELREDAGHQTRPVYSATPGVSQAGPRPSTAGTPGPPQQAFIAGSAARPGPHRFGLRRTALRDRSAARR